MKNINKNFLLSLSFIISTAFFFTRSFAKDQRPGNLEDWLKAKEKTSTSFMMRNISAPGTAKGSVIASPSRENPNYFYHWVRDAALTMDVVLSLYERATDPKEKSAYYQALVDFIRFTKVTKRPKI